MPFAISCVIDEEVSSLYKFNNLFSLYVTVRPSTSFPTVTDRLPTKYYIFLLDDEARRLMPAETKR